MSSDCVKPFLSWKRYSLSARSIRSLQLGYTQPSINTEEDLSTFTERLHIAKQILWKTWVAKARGNARSRLETVSTWQCDAYHYRCTVIQEVGSSKSSCKFAFIVSGLQIFLVVLAIDIVAPPEFILGRCDKWTGVQNFTRGISHT